MPLSRVLEPEVMDSEREARDYDSMDHREVNRIFVDDFLAAAAQQFSNKVEDSPPAEILDVGTGTAQIPIELCRRASGFRITAIDLAVAMLDLARLKVELAGVRDQIMLGHVDAKEMPYRNGQFATVISNSLVHHIPQPEQVLEEILRVTAPEGLIFVRDLMRPDDDEQVHSLVQKYAADANEHQRSMFEASLRAALSLDEVREIVAGIGLPSQTVQATSDRHWTWKLEKGSRS